MHFNYLDNSYEEKYLASYKNELIVLDEDKNEHILIRGQKVEMKNKAIIINDVKYHEIKLENGDKYFASIDNLVSDYNECVLEKELYVKISSSLLKTGSSDIIGLLNKGDIVKIVGFDMILDDGDVQKYQVEYNGLAGEVYAKYLSDNISSEDNEYLEIHMNREEIYGGGSAYDLDYTYFDKVKFEDNIMPEICNTIYINASSLVNIDDYIEFALSNNINAFVIDIKDSHIPTYASKVYEKYSQTTYENAKMTYDDFEMYVSKAKEAGIYLIGRITVFKDTNYATDHPESMIIDKTTNSGLYFNGSYWPSAFKRDIWVYNVELAKEAVVDFGFNEIQFDYTRFPDHIDAMEYRGEIDLLNEYNESKAQAIQRFIMYAADELHSVGAYISVDVFGETSNSYVTAYGQYWPAISNYVDVISAMPYPDHFGKHDYGISKAVWEVPDELLSAWGKDAMKRQEETPSKAIVRTWIQGYDAMRDPYTVYDADMILKQVNALYDRGLDGGFIIWNAASNIERYKSYAEAFDSLPIDR